MRLALSFAPEQVLTVACLAAVVAAAAAFWCAVQGPSLGLQLRDNAGQLEIARVWHQHASVALRPGAKLTALVADGRRIRLQGRDITPEPDASFSGTAEYHAFLARQDRLAQALRARPLGLVVDDSVIVDISLRPQRAAAELPWTFWLQLICGVLGLVAGAAVWAYRQTDPAAGYYMLTGVGLAAAAMSAAVYSSRELALPLTIFDPLRVLNHGGTLLYTAAFVAVLWHYPRRLGRFALGPVLLALYALLTLSAWRNWLPSLDLNLRLPVLAGFCTAVLLGVWQWRNSRGEPLARAGLLWFLFSWFFGSTLFLGLVFVPPLFGVDAARAQAPAFALLLAIHLALAVGILRYRLFDLDRWWYHALLIALSWLLVYGLDIFLVYVLHVMRPLALGAALALVGWLYFPARQWLWLRLTRRSSNDRQPGLIRIVTGVLSRPEVGPEQAWRSLLEQVFAPRSMQRQGEAHRDAVAEAGLALDVCGVAEVAALRLLYCRGGARLFNRADLALLAELRALFAELLHYRQRLESAVAAERDRVARDLHDDVGARLLTLSHNLKDCGAEQARLALSDLRAVVYSMRADPVEVSDLLGEWRAEAADRCEAAGVSFEWTVHGQPPDLALAGGPALTLSRVLRESLSNALHHGTGADIALRLDFSAMRMAVCVSNRYAGDDPTHWQQSLGLNNLRERLARMHGEISWGIDSRQLNCHWSVDLAAAADAGR